jgi:ATP-dependent 26S proteasome regulatory subunit
MNSLQNQTENSRSLPQKIGSILEKDSAFGNRKAQYDHIVLTEEETAEVLRIARKEKDRVLRTQEYHRKISEPKKIISHSPDGYQQILFSKIPGFVIDHDCSEVVKLLCSYFSDGKYFIGQGYDMKKGILLYGNKGCGKTRIMRAFRANQNFSYKAVECLDVTDEFSSQGPEALKQYSNPLSIAENHFGQTQIGIFFDDLGTEEIGNHFQNKMSVMERILQARYQRGLLTHVSTNLSAQMILDTYGERIQSRMKEMFNVIAFPENAKDRR